MRRQRLSAIRLSSPWTPSDKWDFFFIFFFFFTNSKANSTRCSYLIHSASCINYVCSPSCHKCPGQIWSVVVLQLACSLASGAALQCPPNSVPSSYLPQTHHLNRRHSHQSVSHTTGQRGSSSNVTDVLRGDGGMIRSRHTATVMCSRRFDGGPRKGFRFLFSFYRFRALDSFFVSLQINRLRKKKKF